MIELVKLIDLINDTCICLVSGDLTTFAEKGTLVINSCFSVFPKIIAAYSDERMVDLSEDATYWPAQLERIMNTLNNNDLFASFDVLYNETRANLIYIKEEYEQRGVAI